MKYGDRGLLVMRRTLLQRIEAAPDPEKENARASRKEERRRAAGSRAQRQTLRKAVEEAELEVKRLSGQRTAIDRALFEPASIKPDGTVFETGEPATELYLLISGEVTLVRPADDTYRLRPPALIGELGALTGLPRSCRTKG